MEETDCWLSQLENSIFEKNLKSAAYLIKTHKNHPVMPHVLSTFIHFLTVKAKVDDTFTEMVLIEFAEECNAEEVLWQLIKVVNNCVNDQIFIMLSRVLLRAILRLPTKNLQLLNDGLDALNCYLMKKNLPKVVKFDEQDNAVMRCDADVDSIKFLYSSLLYFYRILVANYTNELDEITEETKIIVTKFVLQLFGQPFAFIDLRPKKAISIERRISNVLIEFISDLNWDFISMLELNLCCNNSVTDTLAKATLLYLIFSENDTIKMLPKLYDNIYLFEQLLGLANELFQYTNLFVQHNAVFLTKAILDRVGKITLPYWVLESDVHSVFCTSITHVIIDTHIETHSRKCLDVYRRYLFLFDSKGRYLLVCYLMKILKHTNIIGYTITCLKDMLMQELDKPEPSAYFKDNYLYYILDQICILPKNEIDIIDVGDQTVAFLNLIRYLIIRDKENASGFKNYINKLVNKYLKHLKEALNTARYHYQRRIHEVQKEHAIGVPKDSKLSITIANTILPEPSSNVKINILCLSLTSFDVIQNLVCRVDELIEAM